MLRNAPVLSAVFLSSAIFLVQTGVNAQVSDQAFLYSSDLQQRVANYLAQGKLFAPDNKPFEELYEILIKEYDAYALTDKMLRQHDMRADNLIDVFTLFHFHNDSLSASATVSPTTAQLADIKTRILSQTQAIAALKTLSSSAKQRKADSMMMDMLFQSLMMSRMKGRPVSEIQMVLTELQRANSAFLFFGPNAVVAIESGPANAGQAGTPILVDPKKAFADVIGARFDTQTMFVSAGPVGGINRSDRVEVLFKDGIACWDCFDDLLTDPGLAKYRVQYPNDVGRWKRQGSQYVITYEGTSEPRTYDIADFKSPAPLNTKYSGTFETSGMVTTGNSYVFSTQAWKENLVMQSDGRFYWSNEGGVIQKTGYADPSAYKVEPAKRGRYVIDGYSIRFDFDDSTSVTKAFLYDPKRDFFAINEDPYWVAKD